MQDLSEKQTERETTVGAKVPEGTEREVSQTLPYQTKYLCGEELRQRFPCTGSEKSTACLLSVGQAVT